LRSFGALRKDFCVRLALRAQSHFEREGVPPNKLKDWIETDFSFYGGKELISPDEREGVIEGALSYALRDCVLPE
jgi:hypothetical protein